jgi:hypothetical protein
MGSYKKAHYFNKNVLNSLSNEESDGETDRSLHQKGLAVTDLFFATMMIEAFVIDLQPLVIATTDVQSCIVLGGDARI